jgi:hypothetical protein
LPGEASGHRAGARKVTQVMASLRVGVCTEAAPDERRVAVAPEAVRPDSRSWPQRPGRGAGAGRRAYFPRQRQVDAGATIVSRFEVFNGSDISSGLGHCINTPISVLTWSRAQSPMHSRGTPYFVQPSIRATLLGDLRMTGVRDDSRRPCADTRCWWVSAQWCAWLAGSARRSPCRAATPRAA